MKIAVVGAGAVGGVIAWHLRRAGHAVSVLAREPSAALLRERGLTVTGPDGTGTVSLDVETAPERIGVCDLLIVGLKAYDWPAALPSIRALMGPGTVLIPLLNGIPWWYGHGLAPPAGGRPVESVDRGGVLFKAIEPSRILGAAVYVAAHRDDAARIGWNGRKRLILGSLMGPLSAGARAAIELLKGATIDVETPTDIRSEVWQKLLGNVTFNPLSVLTETTMGRIVATPSLKEVAREMMEETVKVAAGVGVTRTFDITARLDIPAAMRGFKTSMLQDFEAGRRLELDAICEAVVELGSWVQVEAPAIRTVARLAAGRWDLRWGKPVAAPPPAGAAEQPV